MPDHSPLSRYLLLGMAVLILGAALPDADLLLQQARQWRSRRPATERIVVIEPIAFR